MNRRTALQTLAAVPLAAVGVNVAVQILLDDGDIFFIRKGTIACWNVACGHCFSCRRRRGTLGTIRTADGYWLEKDGTKREIVIANDLTLHVGRPIS